MRGFLVAIAGAALLAGCAPFEHGHYSNDVSYVNTLGDPAGTPLVYNRYGKIGSASKTGGATLHASKGRYGHYGHRHAAPTYAPVSHTQAGYRTMATSHGDVLIGPDGYAVCNEVWPDGRAVR